eukprot:scaffold4831_cov47-Phaeocystis_antarctica.AAC.3
MYTSRSMPTLNRDNKERQVAFVRRLAYAGELLAASSRCGSACGAAWPRPEFRQNLFEIWVVSAVSEI